MVTNIKKLVLLLFITLLIFGLFYMKNKGVNSYSFSVNIGYPKNYDAIYDYNDCYFYDSDKKAILDFGGMIAASGEWGDGSQNTILSGQYPLPYGFKIKWYSVVENQFWEGDFKLNQELLFELFRDGFIVFDKEKPHSNFSVFIFNVTPGGMVSLWLWGGGESILIGTFQAKKIDTDWKDFLKPSTGYAVNRDEFRDMYLKDGIEKFLSKDAYDQLITNIPFDSQPWKKLLKNYSYSVNINNRFKLNGYRAWYINGEALSTYSKKIKTKQALSIPYRMYMLFISPKGQEMALEVYLETEGLQEQFDTLCSSNNTCNLQLELNENMTEGFMYLNNNIGEKVELKIKKIALIDAF